MKMPKTLILLLSLLALLVFTACESEGPAEQAGEKIDNAVEEAQEGLEEAGDAIKVQSNVASSMDVVLSYLEQT